MARNSKTVRNTLAILSKNRTRNSKENLNTALNGLLGEGFHGKAYRLNTHLKGETFLSLLENKEIKKIKLYTSDYSEDVYLTEHTDIKEFLDFIGSRRGLIAKVFKSVFLLTGVSTQQDLEDELDINRRIIKYYGNKADKYLTVAPVQGFRSFKVLGCYFEFLKGGTLYAALGSACDNKFPMNIHSLAIDILESLVILQEAGYQHNDIKLDNIVRCKGQYKLIDWGQASSIEEFKFGDMICTNPLKWYIKGFPSYVSKYLMDYRTSMINSPYQKSDIFQQKNKQIITDFNTIIGNNPDLNMLHSKYKRNLDVFMLGMTLLHAVFKFELNYEKYRELIDRMTSLKHPWSSAKEALHYTKQYLKKLRNTSLTVSRKSRPMQQAKN
jgi:serine/threonine protein kinase